MKPVVKRLVILGVGLMGGSLAMAAKKAGAVEQVVGWSRRQSTLDLALENGVIDIACSELQQALQDADCVVVATPTIFAEDLMVKVLESVDATVTVTDVASVKGNIAMRLEQAFGAVPANAVLAHPIAGSEQSGVGAAQAELYQHHHVILTPTAQSDASHIALVQQLWEAVGARVFEMSVAEHDRVLALTSHLPHLLAYTLVAQLSASDDAENVFRFAAGGFRDFTRIASSDPTMWREIMLANKSALRATIDGFETQLSTIKKLLDDDDGESLHTLFSEVKHTRDAFAEALAKRKR